MKRTRSSLLPFALAALLADAAQAQFTEQKLLASDGQAGDAFGSSLAMTHDLRVVGAGGVDSLATDAGAVYVFRGCSSLAETKLEWSAGSADDRFGLAVATDGQLIVVGAPQDDSVLDGLGRPGAAVVFRWDGSRWVEEATLRASDGANEDHFGLAVAVDGDTVIVGAPFKSANGAQSGKTYVYEFDGSQWIEAFSVAAGGTNNYGGYSVDVEGDVAASGNLHNGATTPNQVWILRRSAGIWSVEARISSESGKVNENFGMSVSLDGDRLLVGAPALTARKIGYAALYQYDSSSDDWEFVENLEASDGADFDLFGRFVALRGDLAVCGAHGDDDLGTDSGSAYVFRFDGTGFVETEKLGASDGADGDIFGARIATDGDAIATTAMRDDDLGDDSGSAYVFVPPAIDPYGAGLAGAGGLVPSLDATGTAAPGGSITLEIRDFVGGAFTILLVNFAPASLLAFGGTVLVDVGPGLVLWPMSLPGSPGVAGEGDLDVTETVPADLDCVSVYLQQLGFDTAAPRGVSMTNGLEIHFGE
jgi:hypothetical protein